MRPRMGLRLPSPPSNARSSLARKERGTLVLELPMDHEDTPRTDADPPTDERLAAVAHDLRNALASVVGNAQLLARRMRADRADPEDVLVTLAAIERAARRLADGVDRIEGGRGPTVGPRRGFLDAAPTGPPDGGD